MTIPVPAAEIGRVGAEGRWRSDAARCVRGGRWSWGAYGQVS
ncbi:hypothetical protein ACFOVU_25515 [Nocardiopsis sediminis]|uniref:Uncharacterized protein n=1 Tax=Nocardiopsis sediminis TaxID=1778267 RepID=A0ABV8FT02_9ACTN